MRALARSVEPRRGAVSPKTRLPSKARFFRGFSLGTLLAVRKGEKDCEDEVKRNVTDQFREILLAAGLIGALTACGDDEGPPDAGAEEQTEEQAPPGKKRVDSRPPPMAQPVDFWSGGKTERKIDAATASLEDQIVLDLGNKWTPYLFTESSGTEADKKSNEYRPTYIALANERWPKDHHGERAREDEYLELYGIAPSLGVLRKRMQKVSKLPCAEKIDLEPLKAFEGLVVFRQGKKSERNAIEYRSLKRMADSYMKRQKVETLDALDREKIEERDQRRLEVYEKIAPEVQAIRAAQDRLKCEGFFGRRGYKTYGALDWQTRDALARFERRHRIYGWGFIGKDTLPMLQNTPMENERQAVIRVLTERAMLEAGVIEDGSTDVFSKKKGEPLTFVGRDGKEHVVPNLEKQIREALIEAFGLQTPESTLAWLEGLGDLGEAKLAAFQGPAFPEYYDGNMDLSVEVDRGDVWYEFPYDEEGKERAQPVSRRPRAILYTRYLNKRIPLARFGTTIGGWRTEYIDGELMWRYKNSPPGERVWKRIVAAPVWMPPASTPPRALLKRKRNGEWYINYHETGPSYASAYGLVAAYHRKYREKDGEIILGGDEGIRMHGSVDYMSIMRRHSHGCHRLHNHIAVRLMSFVLAHHKHKRLGQQNLEYVLPLKREYEGEEVEMELKLEKGGYVFLLEEPVHVNVLEGRIRGKVEQPIETLIPKYQEEYGAYITPDGGAVEVDRYGNMVSVPMPVMDAGVPMLGSGALGALPGMTPQPVAPPDPPVVPAPKPGPPVLPMPTPVPAPSAP